MYVSVRGGVDTKSRFVCWSDSIGPICMGVRLEVEEMWKGAGSCAVAN